MQLVLEKQKEKIAKVIGLIKAKKPELISEKAELAKLVKQIQIWKG